jgi:hypothetical protein
VARTGTYLLCSFVLGIATTDEQNYSGDYGDFASFTEHLQASARERNVDLLLV